MADFIATGLVVTIMGEWVLTEVIGCWPYAASQCGLSGLGAGLLPLLQWMVLSPLIVWFVRRQLT